MLMLCLSIFGTRSVSGGEPNSRASVEPGGSGYPFEMIANAEHSDQSNRLIEPTSPILGYRLVTHIKEDQHEPAEILRRIRSYSGAHELEIAKSCIAYFNVMIPELNKYQDRFKIDRISEDKKNYTEVEVSAIPLEVLIPLHQNYLTSLTVSNQFVETSGLEIAADSAMRLAKRFQKQKEDCPSVLAMLKDSNPWKKHLPEHFQKLLEINARVSSAESAFPRVQHSINGYLRSVYQYLCEHPRLEELLDASYKSQRSWLGLNHDQENIISLFEYVERDLLQLGFTEKDVLLVMSYASRNMPNIDVEYAIYPEQALALEVYFWKMKPLLSYASEHHLDQVFPNHDFSRNPMIYHYATASYLAYEIRKEGYTGAMATFFAFASKAGYKLYKFKHALSKEALKKNGLENVAYLVRTQSTIPGMEAGYYGGKYGVKLAKQTLRTQRKQARR